MEEEQGVPVLAGLSDADLLGLRLAAQVMVHKAELERCNNVADFFGRLEYAVQAELASRATGIRTVIEEPHLALGEDADDEDRRLAAEYLGLLIANEHLSPALRDACRRLQTVARRMEADA